ncbi:hypothetical protein EUX98_g1544 [Antrodiella citrinella]|uniref:ABM domain-containing protein n=1 Tax=Antrodiella citrinella TaxID=2447956 RepID=A0A4V3XJD5_9APHY|nr:hypothetical protein EUX98_g1544 [Antrodiella citrinella]
MSTAAKLGTFVPLTAKPNESNAVRDYLLARYRAVSASESGTIQWIAVKLAGTQRYLVLNTFASEEGRKAHLDNAIAADLMGKRQAFLVAGDEGMSLRAVELLAHKVKKPAGAGLKFGVRVLMTAKADRAEEVKQLLKDVETETVYASNPPVWFTFWFPGTTQCGIFALFTSEETREAFLTGPGADSRRANAPNLSHPSDIAKVDVIAAKF